MSAPHPEPLQLVLEPQTTELPGVPTKQDGRRIYVREQDIQRYIASLRRKGTLTESLVPWIERKLRERYELPLRRCDREQIQEQLEDL